MKKICLIGFLSFYLLSACTTVNTNSMASYGRAKENFLKKNYAKAYILIQEPAKAGNPDAQYALGYMYYYGKGVTADTEQAYYWFQQAATQGQSQAKLALEKMQG